MLVYICIKWKQALARTYFILIQPRTSSFYHFRVRPPAFNMVYLMLEIFVVFLLHALGLDAQNHFTYCMPLYLRAGAVSLTLYTLLLYFVSDVYSQHTSHIPLFCYYYLLSTLRQQCQCLAAVTYCLSVHGVMEGSCGLYSGIDL